MAKYCADCTYFMVKDKKGEGICKCKKNGKYMPANVERCQNFSEAYSRKWYDREKLYDDAKATLNKPNPSNTSTGTYLFFALILFIIAIIANLFMQ